MTNTRPTNSDLAAFAWYHDIDNVWIAYDHALSKLDALGITIGGGGPFLLPDYALSNWDSASWLVWIESVGPDDLDDILALNRFAETCKRRLEQHEQGGSKLPHTSYFAVEEWPRMAKRFLASMQHSHFDEQALDSDLGLTEGTVARWLSGSQIPPSRQWQDMAEMVGIDLPELRKALDAEKSDAANNAKQTQAADDDQAVAVFEQDHLLSELSSAFESPELRVVTINGEAEFGKARLIHTWSEQLRNESNVKVSWVSTGNGDAARDLWLSVLFGFGERSARELSQPTEDVLAGLLTGILRGLERPSLLVIDDCNRKFVDKEVADRFIGVISSVYEQSGVEHCCILIDSELDGLPSDREFVLRLFVGKLGMEEGLHLLRSLGVRHDDASLRAIVDESKGESQALVAYAALIQGDAEDHANAPMNWSPRPEEVSANVKAAMQSLGSKREVAAIARKNDKQLGRNGDETQLKLPSTVGARVEARRRAGADEHCLGVQQQAAALADFIRSASGEFCMAIFARWGRGKTTLLEHLARILRRDQYYVTFFNAWRYRTTPELWAHLYETVVRSITHEPDLKTDDLQAPHKKRFLRTTALSIRAGVVRAGLLRFSTFAIPSLFVMLPFAAFMHVTYWVSYALSIVGLGAVVYVLMLLRKGTRVSSELQQQFGKLNSHRPTLGLQAAIGDDLRNVVTAAIPREQFGKKWAIIAIAASLLAVGVALCVNQLPTVQAPGTTDGSQWLPELKPWTLYVSIGGWLAIFLFMAGCATFFLPSRRRLLLVVDDLDRCEPQQMLEVIESIKLLLEEEHLHERVQVLMLVEESLLRAAIENKFAAGRTVSASGQNGEFVLDNSGSDAAVANGDSLDAGRRTEIALPVLVDEHLDKLFLAYYRLGELESDQLGLVADKVIEAQLKRRLEQLKLDPDSTSDSIRQVEEALVVRLLQDGGTTSRDSLAGDVPKEVQVSGNVGDTGDGDEQTSDGPSEEVQPSPYPAGIYGGPKQESIQEVEEQGRVERYQRVSTRTQKVDELPFSLEERQQLVAAMGRLPRTVDKSGHSWGPRAVRIFLCRYQLIRLLLDQAGNDVAWTPAEIIDAMILAYRERTFDESVKEEEWQPVASHVRSVVHAVV